MVVLLLGPDGVIAFVAAVLVVVALCQVLGVPTPNEYADEGDRIEDHIQQSLAEADAHNISGNAITPFLLKRVNERSGGASLSVNIALIKNNAAVGATIAVELAKRTQAQT